MIPIKTCRGNINLMRAREGVMKSKYYRDDLQKLIPTVEETLNSNLNVYFFFAATHQFWMPRQRHGVAGPRWWKIPAGSGYDFGAGGDREEAFTSTETQLRSYQACKLLDAHLEDTLVKMKHIQMVWPTGLHDSLLVECTPTAVIDAVDSKCSSTVTSSFEFTPTESDDIEGEKEPFPGLDVSNAESDTSAFGFDIKIGQVAFPSESQPDQITSNTSK
ncbi:unnamed protein product [Caenorhabditis brenneri]